MYSGLSSAITPALLSPAEATGSVAVPPSAEPSAPTPPPPPPTSRYRLDDFSRAQQLQRQQPFANGSDGRKRQAFYEERRQPDKLDFGTIRGKEEEDKSHLSHCGDHLSRFNCSLSGGDAERVLVRRNACCTDEGFARSVGRSVRRSLALTAASGSAKRRRRRRATRPPA